MANKPVDTRASVWTAAALAPLCLHPPAIRPPLLPTPATDSVLESGAEATAVQTLRAFPVRCIEIRFDIQGCALAFAAACWMSASASGAFRSNVSGGNLRFTACSLNRMSV